VAETTGTVTADAKVHSRKRAFSSNPSCIVGDETEESKEFLDGGLIKINDDILAQQDAAEQLLSIRTTVPHPTKRQRIESEPIPQDGTKEIKIDSKPEPEDNKETVVEDKTQHVEKTSAKKSNSSESNSRSLPPEAVAILKEWILSPQHFNFPYPTNEEKKVLMNKTGLTLKQLKYWFINARRRIWKQKNNEKLQNDKLLTTEPSNNVAVEVNDCSPVVIHNNSPKIRPKEQVDEFSELQTTNNALTRPYPTLPPTQSLSNLNTNHLSKQLPSFLHQDNLCLPPSLDNETGHIRMSDAPMLADFDIAATTFSLTKNFKPPLTAEQQMLLVQQAADYELISMVKQRQAAATAASKLFPELDVTNFNESRLPDVNEFLQRNAERNLLLQHFARSFPHFNLKGM